MVTKNYYCPEHKKKLVLRDAKHGINRGQKFWGCPTWSKTACNYTIPYESINKIETTIKEKFLDKIKNKQGKISILKLTGQIFLIPIYILGFLANMVMWVFREKRKRGF